MSRNSTIIKLWNDLLRFGAAFIFVSLILCGSGRAENTNATLQVMTFNIRYGTAPDGENAWSNRQELVVQTISDFAPDLLGLQEVLDFQGEYLKERLAGYDFHGVGRDDGKREGEFAPVLFRRDRFELLDSGHFWLSPTPEVPGSRGWDAALPRICSWVRLKDRMHPQGQLLLLNTHFDHMGSEARLESARLIRSQINRLRSPGDSAVLTGDFNATEDDPPYSALVGPAPELALELIDSYRAVHPQRGAEESTFHDWKGGNVGRRIDWILYSEGLVAIGAEINRVSRAGQFPSDHYPVQVRLQYQ